MSKQGLSPQDCTTLSAPFPRETLGIKVNSYSRDKTKAMLVCYLQHTDVYARIEQVDPDWSSSVLDEKFLGETVFTRVRLTIKGVNRENVGEGNDPKSALSDAMKRAAMLFGIGRYLYDAETVWVPFNEATDKFKKFTLEDFERALRPGQDKTPTAESASAKAGVKSGQPFRPTAQTAPATISPKPAAKNSRSVEAEIFKVGASMNMTQPQVIAWAEEHFGKLAPKITASEMEQFLNVMLGEAGRNGYAV